MDIRYKLYPYPVLSVTTDDYKNSRFVFKVQKELGIREIILKFSVELKNKELLGLVRTGRAEYVVHIECPYTSYREVVKFEDTEYVQKIPEKRLNGKVSLCAFLVAKVPSIFTICRSAADCEEEMKIDIADHKIAITLSSESFQNYKLLAGMPRFVSVLHAMLILPALIYVFETLTREGTEDFETRRWFRVIEKTLEKDNIVLNEDTLNNIPSYELAQKLLDLPIQKSLSMMVLEDDVEEE